MCLPGSPNPGIVGTPPGQARDLPLRTILFSRQGLPLIGSPKLGKSVRDRPVRPIILLPNTGLSKGDNKL